MIAGLSFGIPYIALFLFLIVISFPLVRGKYVLVYDAPKRALILSLLIFFIAFRAFVFTDWINYYVLYENTPSLFEGFGTVYVFFTKGWYATKEKGFLLYAVICKTVSDNYFFFQAVSSVIDIFILYTFFKKYLRNSVMFAFAFFMVFRGLEIEFNLLRNSKSIMLFLISIQYIRERKIVNYMFLNIVGMLFHVSSIIYLFLYFILHKKISRMFLLFLFIVGNVFYLAEIKWIKNLLLLASTFIDSRIGILIRLYLESELYSSSYGIGLGYLERTMSFVIVFLFYHKLMNRNTINIIFMNCAFLYWFVYLYCSEMYVLLQRIPLLFVFSYWVLYPQIYSILSRQFKYVFLLILLVYGGARMSLYNISYMYENIFMNYLPYQQKKVLVLEYLEENAENRLRR
jgi:hypothetical protein